MIYVFYQKDYEDKTKTRNIKLRQYFKELKKAINKPTSQIISECGHGVVRSLSKTFSSQFTLPSEIIYNKLIHKYHIDTMPDYIEYSELRKLYEKPTVNTYNPQKTDGKPYKDKVKQSEINSKLSNYSSKLVQSSNETGQRFPTSIIRFKPDTEKYIPHKNP